MEATALGANEKKVHLEGRKLRISNMVFLVNNKALNNQWFVSKCFRSLCSKSGRSIKSKPFLFKGVILSLLSIPLWEQIVLTITTLAETVKLCLLSPSIQSSLMVAIRRIQTFYKAQACLVSTAAVAAYLPLC